MAGAWIFVHFLLDLLVFSEADLALWGHQLRGFILIGTGAGHPFGLLFDPGVLADGIAAAALEPAVIVVLELLVGLRLGNALLRGLALCSSPALSASPRSSLICVMKSAGSRRCLGQGLCLFLLSIFGNFRGNRMRELLPLSFCSLSCGRIGPGQDCTFLRCDRLLRTWRETSSGDFPCGSKWIHRRLVPVFWR